MQLSTDARNNSFCLQRPILLGNESFLNGKNRNYCQQANSSVVNSFQGCFFFYFEYKSVNKLFTTAMTIFSFQK